MKTTVPNNEQSQNNFNCLNCGAAVTWDKCKYCGTIFHDFTSLTVNESSYLIINIDDRKYLVKAVLQDVTGECVLGSIPELSMRFRILPMDNMTFRYDCNK